MRKTQGFILSLLGVWMIGNTLIFPVRGGLCALDSLAGLFLIGLTLLSLRPKREWSLWLIALLGLWIQFVPLLFWVQDSGFYLNSTVCGLVAMTVSFRTLSRPPLSSREEMPYNGWSFNPSSWGFRIPNIFLALICSLIARYLAAYQLGLIPTVWDPIFGDGTHLVLTSQISKDFPVSDAGLGSLAYLIEALMGCQGDAQRFRTMPWAVILFGFLVVPVSLVSILLIILQPLAVHAWCSWCLLIGFIMVFMIPLAVGEFVAGIRFLHQSVRQGSPFWKLFLYGEDLSAKVVSAHFLKQRKVFSFSGVSLPWNLLASAALGIWVVISPSVFTVPVLVSSSNYIIGPLVFAFSIISCAEVIRIGRFLNLPLVLWLILIPWFSAESSLGGVINHMVVGILLIFLNLRKGPIHQRYGKLQKFIF